MNVNDIPVIAIDGPSASGKGTVAQRVAEKLGFHYLDSGALYRLVALAAMRAKVDLTDVLVHVLRRIEANVWSLAKSDPRLPARWRELSLLTDRHVAVQQGSRRVEGMCAGIDDEGALLLDTPDGRQRMFGGTVG